MKVATLADIEADAHSWRTTTRHTPDPRASPMHGSRALFLAVSVLVACGGSDSPTDVAVTETGGTSTATLIDVRDNSFSPNTTTVPLGATVTWTWTGANAHNVTFVDRTRSATQSTGSFRRTFTAEGPFQYSCTLHPGMTGTVNVK